MIRCSAARLNVILAATTLCHVVVCDDRVIVSHNISVSRRQRNSAEERVGRQRERVANSDETHQEDH